ncbi:MAG TPA: hypothetical protein VGP89_03425 [Candidatus Angelobacter sp.]|jgi:hypothetical protein|nr:hypothetical protein [Candidatus Angelobacter sp.]
MKKISLTAILFLTSAMAFGQGACSPDKIALKDTGRPAGGASIKVCPAGGVFPGCASSLFTDPTLSVGAGNPVTADALGNWGFCAAAGANYDYQITCSGCTTLTVKNYPLPPTTPITAASVTSASANPANVGTIKLATGDCIDWRNFANTGNIQLCKFGAAAGTVPADAFDMTAAATRSQAFIDNSANPAASGVVRAGNNVCAVAARNAGNSADVCAVQVNASNQVTLGSGPVIVPALADTAALLAAAQTLTNKTLTAPVVTSPNTSGTDSGAETLQNKTLNGAASGNSVTLLNSQDPLAAVTGNGTDLTLYTFTVPANTVQAGKGIRVRTISLNNNNTAVTYKLILGATTLSTFSSAAAAGGSQRLDVDLFNNAGVQNAQTTNVFAVDNVTIVGNSAGTAAENFAGALVVKVTANEAAASTVTPKKWTVELIQ